MMEVQKFLASNSTDALTDQYGILVRKYEDERIMVLNYSQIDSPKTAPIVRECRGLTLDYDLNVVTRSFDRFFNAGEADCADFSIDPKTDVVCEKLDGSLIRCYYFGGMWRVGTRGTAFAETAASTGDRFFDLVMRVYESHDEFQKLANEYLDPSVTYSLEFTAVENRVVTRYTGYNLHILAARKNATGEYVEASSDVVHAMKWNEPAKYSFDSLEACVKAAGELPNLEEGYVVYRSSVPVCKIKSPAYVAVHHVRGEGLTPRRMIDLVAVVNEIDEYLSYFPEDRSVVQPYIDAFESILDDSAKMWECFGGIEDRKEFALCVKDSPLATIMFNRRNHQKDAETTIRSMSDSARMNLFNTYLE